MARIFDINEPKFWVSAAFILLVVLAYKKVSTLLIHALDEHSNKIKNELEAVRKLRTEAEETLALYKQKQAEFTKEAEDILAKARADANTNTAQAQIELKASLDARLKQALEKIAQEEAAAVADVRNHVVDITMAAAKNIIVEQMNAISQAELLKRTMADFDRSKLH